MTRRLFVERGAGADVYGRGVYHLISHLAGDSQVHGPCGTTYLTGTPPLRSMLQMSRPVANSRVSPPGTLPLTSVRKAVSLSMILRTRRRRGDRHGPRPAGELQGRAVQHPTGTRSPHLWSMVEQPCPVLLKGGQRKFILNFPSALRIVDEKPRRCGKPRRPMQRPISTPLRSARRSVVHGLCGCGMPDTPPDSRRTFATPGRSHRR